MNYLWAFVIGGLICVIGQLLIDLTPVTPARILVGYVVGGVVLSALGWYQPLVELAGGGSWEAQPESSRAGRSSREHRARFIAMTSFVFGHLLAQGVREAVDAQGWLGAFLGGFTAASAGICASLIFGVFFSLIAKSRDQN